MNYLDRALNQMELVKKRSEDLRAMVISLGDTLASARGALVDLPKNRYDDLDLTHEVLDVIESRQTIEFAWLDSFIRQSVWLTPKAFQGGVFQVRRKVMVESAGPVKEHVRVWLARELSKAVFEAFGKVQQDKVTTYIVMHEWETPNGDMAFEKLWACAGAIAQAQMYVALAKEER